MANFDTSFNIMKNLEFSTPSNCLHKNKTENGLTYFGIYETAHPKWQGWRIVKQRLAENNGDLKATSAICFNDFELLQDVKAFYVSNFWRVLKCDEIINQKIADNLFCFGVNVGTKNAIKCLQRALGVVDDGLIGYQTLTALNKGDSLKIVDRYKQQQRNYYDRLCANNNALKIYLKGWYNRIERT